MSLLAPHTPRPAQRIVTPTLGALLFFCTLLLGTLRQAAQASLQTAGLGVLVLLMLVGLFFLFVYTLHNGRIHRSFVPFLFWAYLLCILHIVTLLMYGLTNRSITTVSQIVLVLGFFLWIALYPHLDALLKVAPWVLLAFIGIHCLLWAASGFPRIFRSIYAHPNSIGAFSFFATFFLIIGVCHARTFIARWACAAGFLAALLLIVASGSRSTWVSAAITGLTYLCWRSITAHRWGFVAYLGTVFVGIFLFVYGYPVVLPTLDIFPLLQDIVYTYTGKNLLSGREQIWPALIAAILEQPWLGYGPGTVASVFTPSYYHGLSAHNLYLQVSLQIGLSGLALLLLTVSSIWQIFWWGRADGIVRIAGAYFIAVLTHQMFEVALTQNNLSVGLIQWTIIGIGANQAVSAPQRSRAVDAAAAPQEAL